MNWLVAWWDEVELWLVQLPYPLQVTLVLGVLVPLCWAVAYLLDGGVGRAMTKLSTMRSTPNTASTRRNSRVHTKLVTGDRRA